MVMVRFEIRLGIGFAAGSHVARQCVTRGLSIGKPVLACG